MTQPVAHFDGGGTPDKVSQSVKPTKPAPSKALAQLQVDGVIRRRLPLWEERWDKDTLQKQRADMTGRDFDRGFRQIAISDEDLYFPPAAVASCLDDKFSAVEYLDPDERFIKMTRYVGVDLAIAAAEKEGAYFVITVIAVDTSANRWLLWLERSRGLSFDGQVRAIEDINERFRPVTIQVENNGYQEAICQTARQKKLPVASYTTTAMSKRDLEIGLPSLGAEFEQSRWHIPNKDAKSKRIMKPLLDELNVYPLAGFHDDCVMSMFFSREGVRLAAKAVPRIHFLNM